MTTTGSGSPWEFLPDDEVVDGGGRGPEEAAMHETGSSAHRPGGWPIEDDAEDEPNGDTEEAVDTLLRRQHYLSGPAEPRPPRPRAPRPDAGVMTQVPPEQARAWLLAERDRLNGLVTLVDHDGAGRSQDELFAEHAGGDQHPADSATETFELEVARSLASTFEWELREVAAALARVETGSYGRCESCGQLIDPERLEVVPATRFCVIDEAAAEAG